VKTLESLQFVFFAVLAFLPAQPLLSSDMRSILRIKDDSVKAGNFYTIAVQYAKDSHLDSSNIYFEKAGIIWKDHERWKNYLDCLQRISKNLVRQRKFTQALNVLTEGVRIGEKKCNSQCDELGRVDESQYEQQNKERSIRNLYSKAAKLGYKLAPKGHL